MSAAQLCEWTGTSCQDSDPCPFAGDGQCDVGGYSSLCENGDWDDCENPIKCNIENSVGCYDNLTLLTIQPTSKMSTSVCDDNLTLLTILALAIAITLLLILINVHESFDKVFDERNIAFGEIETLIAEFDEERETLKAEIEELRVHGRRMQIKYRGGERED